MILIQTLISFFTSLVLMHSYNASFHRCLSFHRYITRYQVKDSSRHVILGVQQFKPAEFGAQINLSMDNAWGIVRCIVDLVRKQKDGKYLIVKDPMKPVIRLYDIPDSTFESEDESDDEDEGKWDLEIKAFFFFALLLLRCAYFLAYSK